MLKVSYINSRFAILLIVLAAIISASCEKLELPSNNGNKHDVVTTDTANNSAPKDTTNHAIPSQNDSIATDTTENGHEVDLSDIDYEMAMTYFDENGNSASTAHTVAAFKTYIQAIFFYTGCESISNTFVTGYIVGYVDGITLAKTVFSSTNAPATNIVLASSPNETNPSNCIAVQLSTSSNIQSQTRLALNLSDHPENLHKKVILQGKIEKYMGSLGLKGAKNHKFVQ